MSARIVLSSAAAGLTAFLAAACTINTINNNPDSGPPAPDTGTPDGGLALDTGTGADADAGSTGDVATSADGSADQSADQTISPADGSPMSEASVGSDGSLGSDGMVIVGNGCSDPPANNQTPATATPYTIGTAVHACLRSGTDVNYYTYTVPTSAPKGGYVIVKVSDVGLTGTIDMSAQAASDSAELVHASDGTGGGGVAIYFAAAPGATFRAIVKNYFNPPMATPETPYTFAATFTGVNDPNAPNGTIATAATMALGTPVQGYFFAGYDSSMAPAPALWESWYKIALPIGMTTIALTNVAPDATGDVELFDPGTQSIASHANSTNGGNVQFSATAATAGTYYIRVRPYFTPATKGGTPTVPVYMTQPWTLRVTSP